ncbi:LytR/AlgR family response regulator transcription factor [Gemmatimonas sp.]|uniref:LytR/AlgR family response regulator transcription factor n=1 Tax=Gemmatimonas sp. TaxID=1962908 RepID=UPI003DA5BFCD
MSEHKLRVLLVDDEPLANVELRRLLEAHHAVLEVVGVCEDATAARDAIDRLSPDVIFLDIALPDESGIGLLASLDPSPAVVFVTAFSEHAVQAFALSAEDYLLKPVNAARLDQAVARLLTRADRATPEPRDLRRPLRSHERIFLHDTNARLWLIAVAEIMLLEVAGEGTRVLFGRGVANSPRSLRAIEPRLPDDAFFRANRSQIIALKYVRQVHPWFAGRLKVTIDGGIEVFVSRRQARALVSGLSL